MMIPSMRRLSMRRALVAALFFPALACSSAVTGGGGGSAGGGTTTTGDPAKPGVKHAACQSPTPDPLPAVPAVNVGPDGRPRFDEWRDLDCQSDAVAVVATCASSCDNSQMCIGGAGGGVCIVGDADIWCDGEGEVIGFRDGGCWICGPLEAHAAACCQGVPGFDCRAWPYPADGKAGQPCARHADCEPGLVCGPSDGKGYGICQCPGTQVTVAGSCWQ